MRLSGLRSRLSLRSRAVPAICAAGLLGLALVFGLAWLYARAVPDRRAERSAANLAGIAAQAIGRSLASYDLSLQAVTRGMEVPGLWELSPELRHMVLFDRAATAAQFGFLNVLNEDGEVVADLQSRSPRPANFAARDYFQALRRDPHEQLYVGRPVLTGPGQFATVPLARRRVHPDGTFAGVVVGSMRLNAVQELFAGLDLGEHGSIALLRNDGVILVRLPFNADDTGRTMSAAAPAMRLLNDNLPVITAADSDGIVRTTVQHRIGDLPLTISVGLADADAETGWRIEAVILATAIAGLCAAAWFVSREFARVRAERDRARAVAENARAEQVRTTTTVSHELRTPLTSLLCYAEMLDEADLPPAHAGRLAALQGAGEHLRQVIDRLLEVTRTDADLSQPRPVPVRLDDVIAQSRILLDPNARFRGLLLKSRIAPELPRFVLLDAANVRMAICNLLSNAIKYTDNGEVTLIVTGPPGHLRFEVADTGPGVPAGKRGRLFREYDRLDQDRAVPGLGIGLCTTKRVVEAMGGKIGYKDNPGGGSIFWFEIPLAEAHEPTTGATPAAMQAAMQAAEPSLRILLVEDDATNRDVAVTLLSDAGHQVTTAANGAEGLHLTLAEEFDLIITDMRMPRMNGLEMACRIRNLNDGRGQIPILLLSADMQVSRLPEYESARISLLLPKPYNRAQFLGAVRATMSRKKFSPEPERERASPLFDEAMLEELAASLDPQDLASHLQVLSGRIEELIERLRESKGEPDQALSDLAHDTGSTSGLLGFTALSGALRRYQLATPEEQATNAPLIALAGESLALLKNRMSRQPVT